MRGGTAHNEAMRQSTFTSGGAAPFVFGNLRPDSRRMSATNADGVRVVPPTEEQRFTFDTQGCLCIPGVLEDAELAEMREFCYRLEDRPESLPDHRRAPVAGPREKLIDHPTVCACLGLTS